MDACLECANFVPMRGGRRVVYQPIKLTGKTWGCERCRNSGAWGCVNRKVGWPLWGQMCRNYCEGQGE